MQHPRRCHGNWAFRIAMTWVEERTIGQTTLTCQFDEENDECNGSNHLDQPNGLSLFMPPSTTTSTSNSIRYLEEHCVSFAAMQWGYGKALLRLHDQNSRCGFVRYRIINVTVPTQLPNGFY